MKAAASSRSMTAGPRALFACAISVSIGGAAPRRHHYEGLFRSTTDAILDAMDRYPGFRSVSAKVGGKQR